VKKSKSSQKKLLARKDGSLGELWTCLREGRAAPLTGPYGSG
jgi:hypothetical protein